MKNPSLTRSIALVFFLFFYSFRLHAEFKAVFVGINGLTCSQCSKAVEMQLRKLDFVADVQMNLQHTEGKILLVENKKADMEQIARAVINAGFSVRFLEADFLVEDKDSLSHSCLRFRGDSYYFLRSAKVPGKGIIKLKFIGKQYMPGKEFKKMQEEIHSQSQGLSGKTYYVTLLQ